MLAVQNDLATVGDLRRLLASLGDMDPGATVEWSVKLYDGPLTEAATGEVSVADGDVEIVVCAPVAPTAVAPDASWVAA